MTAMLDGLTERTIRHICRQTSVKDYYDYSLH